jgi:hypothetical protein
VKLAGSGCTERIGRTLRLLDDVRHLHDESTMRKGADLASLSGASSGAGTQLHLLLPGRFRLDLFGILFVETPDVVADIEVIGFPVIQVPKE